MQISWLPTQWAYGDGALPCEDTNRVTGMNRLAVATCTQYPKCSVECTGLRQACCCVFSQVMRISFLVEIYIISTCPSAFETAKFILINLGIGGSSSWW
jgi:hypothetical protein